MSGIDPLKLIRQALSSPSQSGEAPFIYCTAAGEVLGELLPECTHIAILSGQSSPLRYIYPRSCNTNFRSKRGQGPCYPLESVCFLLEHRDAAYTDYLQEARRMTSAIVSLTDKKELIEFLTNPEADSSYLDTSAELPVPLEHFPESAEGRKQQQQQQQQAQQKRPVPKDEVSFEGSESKRVKEGTLVCNLVRPVRPVNALFHSSKDFTSVALGLKNVFASVPSTSNTSSTPAASLFDQISSANPADGKKSGSVGISAHQPWIIIVPAGSSALLTLYNAQEFLTAGNYVSVQQARAAGAKPVNVAFKHNGVTFEVIDNPARLALSDWSRVLACFCVTSTWQFKGWKWENPVELFQHILGFHLYFDDMAVDAIVAGWNVTKIPINRNRRYLDATAVMNFWNRIEESLKNRK